VASWESFESEVPEIAASGRRLLDPGGDGPIAFLATASADGRPHVAPVCPIFARGALYLSAGVKTPKRCDLEQNGRFALHAFLGASDEEFQLRGRAEPVTDAAEIAEVHAAIPFQFQKEDPLFRLDLERCLWVYWEKPGQPGTYAVRKRWSASGGAV
jgi:hypothetical protein